MALTVTSATKIALAAIEGDKMFITEETDLIKARSHKYVKRTGSPGNYQYWYEMPDGSLQVGDAEQGQSEHVQRLAEGKVHGHHAMSRDEIHAMINNDPAKKEALKRKIGIAISNATRDKERGASFHEHHIHEAKHTDTGHSLYENHISRTPENTEVTRRPRAARPAAAPASGGATVHTATPAEIEAHNRGRSADGPARHPTPEPTPAPSAPAERRDLHGRTSAEAASDRSRGAAARAARREAATPSRVSDPDMARPSDTIGSSPSPAAREQEQRAIAATEPTDSRGSAPASGGRLSPEQQAELLKKLKKEHGINFDSESQPQPEQATASSDRAAVKRAAQVAERVRQASSPEAPAAPAVYSAAPELQAADEPIQRMMEAQTAGENPYIKRAAEIYHNIQADIKPERREVAKHMLAAISAVKDSSGKVNEAALLAKYKELSGKNVRGLSGVGEEFEKATFMTLSEVMSNEPINPEVERMKRGFAAKQFARMKPYIKQSWLTANPQSPPPFPTFGDVKSWSEHGGPKPEWAGTTRLALPKEVHDAAHKGADGKPKHPPAWMPIHMAPTWQYIMKKAGDDSAYQTRNVNIQQGRLNLGNQAQYQEGVAISAMRKYIQMRGGADQLTDIPANKLSEAGLTHADIYKAMKFDPHDMSDSAIKKLSAHKIIDPIALAPFIDSALKETVKKSWSLVVDSELPTIDFKKSFVLDMKKAELISKIKRLKAEA